MSGPEGSSTKRFISCDGGVPGRSQLFVHRLEGIFEARCTALYLVNNRFKTCVFICFSKNGGLGKNIIEKSLCLEIMNSEG